MRNLSFFQCLSPMFAAATYADSISDAEMRELARRLTTCVRDGARSIPRDEVLPQGAVQMLQMATLLAHFSLRTIRAAHPALEGAEELSLLDDAVDELDEVVDDHRVAREVPRLLAATRGALHNAG